MRAIPSLKVLREAKRGATLLQNGCAPSLPTAIAAALQVPSDKAEVAVVTGFPGVTFGIHPRRGNQRLSALQVHCRRPAMRTGILAAIVLSL